MKGPRLEGLITEMPPFDGTQVLMCTGRWYKGKTEYGVSVHTVLATRMTDMDMVRASVTGFQPVIDQYLKWSEENDEKETA